jgi:hypothetical protein
MERLFDTSRSMVSRSVLPGRYPGAWNSKVQCEVMNCSSKRLSLERTSLAAYEASSGDTGNLSG